MPYTYSITHLETNTHYYGARFVKTAKPEDLGTTYFSSSRALKRLIKLEGKDAFKFKVRRIFDTKDAAAIWEHKFLTRVNAAGSSNWFNLTNGFVTAPFDATGIKRTELTKRRMRKPKSPEHKAKLAKHLSEARTIPEWTKERKQKHSKQMRGNTLAKGHNRVKSPEELKALSERMMSNNYYETRAPLSQENRQALSERMKTSNIGRSSDPDVAKKISESNKGKKRSDDTRAAISNALKGKPKSACAKSKMSTAALSQPTVKCPHCHKTGKNNAMKRWHFHNCRLA